MTLIVLTCDLLKLAKSNRPRLLHVPYQIVQHRDHISSSNNLGVHAVVAYAVLYVSVHIVELSLVVLIHGIDGGVSVFEGFAGEGE